MGNVLEDSERVIIGVIMGYYGGISRGYFGGDSFPTENVTFFVL